MKLIKRWSQHASSSVCIFVALVLSLLLAACGGGGGSPVNPPSNQNTPTYTVGGVLSGLPSGTQIVLTNYGSATPLTLNANGAFTFPSAWPGSYNYSVTVISQPTASICSVTNPDGSVTNANVTNVQVKCNPVTIEVFGMTFGLLNGSTVTLLINGVDVFPVSANGTFNFTTHPAADGTFAMTIGTQPFGETCMLYTRTAFVGSGPLTVDLTCATSFYAVSGVVSSLTPDSQVILGVSGSNATVTVSSNGSFAFPPSVPINGDYAVSVITAPPGQICTVTNGSGSGVTANITNVQVACSANSYTVSGVLSGLTAGTRVVLRDNVNDSLIEFFNGPFTFQAPIASGGGYQVVSDLPTTTTQPLVPTGQVCTVTNGSGSNVAANIINVQVTCSGP